MISNWESCFKKAKVLLLGDFMLDAYTFGNAARLSPEAPVPLLSVDHETFLPGGGGNTILNLLSIGMEVIAFGRVGKDWSGEMFLKLLDNPDLDTSAIIVDEEFQTPLKRRIIAQKQQLLRVDYEKVTPLSPKLEKILQDKLKEVIKECSIMAISDYGKGFFTPSFLQFAIHLAEKNRVPVIVDPKGRDFTKYKKATLIKPNLNEAITASALCPTTPLKEVAAKLFDITNASFLMITRSSEGLSLFSEEGEESHFPAIEEQICDVTGAGDTVFAIIIAAMANRQSLKTGAYLANIAASLVVKTLGCGTVTKEEIGKKLSLQSVPL